MTKIPLEKLLPSTDQLDSKLADWNRTRKGMSLKYSRSQSFEDGFLACNEIVSNNYAAADKSSTPPPQEHFGFRPFRTFTFNPSEGFPLSRIGKIREEVKKKAEEALQAAKHEEAHRQAKSPSEKTSGISPADPRKQSLAEFMVKITSSLHSTQYDVGTRDRSVWMLGAAVAFERMQKDTHTFVEFLVGMYESNSGNLQGKMEALTDETRKLKQTLEAVKGERDNLRAQAETQMQFISELRLKEDQQWALVKNLTTERNNLREENADLRKTSPSIRLAEKLQGLKPTREELLREVEDLKATIEEMGKLPDGSFEA